MKDISGFTDTILMPSTFIDSISQVPHVYATDGGEALGGTRRHPNDSDAAWRRVLGRRNQHWSQKLGEEEGSEIIGAEL